MLDASPVSEPRVRMACRARPAASLSAWGQRTFGQRLVLLGIKTLLRILCRVDAAQLDRVPAHGPLILLSNHVNFLDVPVVFTHLYPRVVTGFAKAETWDSPFLGPLFTLWRAIPLRRGEADMGAIRQALAALEAGCILGLAPEGTRSGDGRLQRGHAGVVTLALRSGAPLLPCVFYGGERFWSNLRRLRRTDFHIIVGQPFYLDARGERVTRQVRQQMTDEIMYRLAALLPPEYRGVYADLSAATTTYLRYLSADG